MAGLVPAIHVFLSQGCKDVDARHPSTPRLRRAFSVLGRRSFSEGGKAGHDGKRMQIPHVTRCSPASIRTNSPVMLLDCAVARKHTSAAISSAVEATLSGTFDTTISRTCLAPASPRPLVNQSVSI